MKCIKCGTKKESNEYKNKKKQWTPKLCEDYYFVNSFFEVRCVPNIQIAEDFNRIINGNCFKTKKEAEKKAFEVRQLFKK